MSATKEKLHDVIEQGMRSKEINALELFKKLHDSEINFYFTSFWDSDFTFKIGDDWNGFKAEYSTTNIEEGLKWLELTAIELYPNSKFEKEGSKNNYIRSADSFDLEVY
jgi:hypothetical protein